MWRPARSERADFGGWSWTFWADTMTFASDRRRRDWVGRSHERTHAQSRAGVGCLARARSLYDPTRIASDDSAARGCAVLIPGAFPACLQLPANTSRNTASVRRRRNPNSTPRSASQWRNTPRSDIGHDERTHPQPPTEWSPGGCATGRYYSLNNHAMIFSTEIIASKNPPCQMAT